MIPFSPPRITDDTISEVTKVLKSGWITTGPRTKEFEKEITAYCGNKSTVCVNSWTMGMQVLLNWWGIGKGDEIILPAYTYCASGNVVLHSGAKLVLVDIGKDDFNIALEAVENAITPRTKAIIPVDIGGLPVDFDELYKIVDKKVSEFQPSNDLQKKLGRIAIFSDAAHSFGAIYKGKRIGSLADVSVFSFHAVKNLTTAEGGAICFNLPKPFDNDEIYKEFCVKILHGQSKDALAKTQKGAWRYDVEEPGFKCNMTDLQAAIGLVELKKYKENLARRKEIFHEYLNAFKNESWAINPVFETKDKTSSYHLYQLRIKNASEKQRDLIVQEIAELEVSVNVHFQPLPLLTAYTKRGYFMADFQESWRKYENEISLPVYFDLTDEQLKTVISAVKSAVQKVIG
ncbi:MAG: DegT/DnrJ/EryC1/StrS aminotransferase family protein [Brumimicrobium sp.]